MGGPPRLAGDAIVDLQQVARDDRECEVIEGPGPRCPSIRDLALAILQQREDRFPERRNRALAHDDPSSAVRTDVADRADLRGDAGLAARARLDQGEGE